jgi:hypothetical protein
MHAFAGHSEEITGDTFTDGCGAGGGGGGDRRGKGKHTVMARDVEPYATTTAIPYIILLLLLPSDPSSVNTSPPALDGVSRCAILR